MALLNEVKKLFIRRYEPWTTAEPLFTPEELTEMNNAGFGMALANAVANNPQNAAHNAAAQNVAGQYGQGCAGVIAGGMLGGPAQQLGGLQTQYAEPTLLDKLKRKRQVHKARDQLHEFFAAQLELDLFKNDSLAYEMWLRAIKAAIDQVEKEV